MEPVDSKSGPLHTVVVAVAVCLVCSVLVSTTSVLLRPLQAANRERVRKQQVLDIVASQPGLEDLLTELGGVSVEARVVELDSGAYADWVDPSDYDARRAARDPLHSIELLPERDLADIGRRAHLATVYLVQRDGRVELVILPVYGSGYASTLYGYLALGPDGNTVRGLSFHEHGETPGLGSEIEDPDWLAQWVGKRVRDESGRVRIGVAAPDAGAETALSSYEVDGLTGATRTSAGVTGLLRFWLGDDGFAPYLARFQP